MTETKEYRMVRIAPETHRKLRIIAAQTDESIISLIDRLATQEYERITNQPTSNHLRTLRS